MRRIYDESLSIIIIIRGLVFLSKIKTPVNFDNNKI